ncbi:DDB1- and CUL4-associated factor 13-like [Schistocerca gregaria]|uniref:DDB1- and CUL4-associated factor 13-like n=1 Tax=Schistocerca gregaria TaxID=7010 RepID=UPI00211EF807|nr:DDB1- and CUL4-associated factor 13-like [Schistocerca gregaria]
MKIKVLERNPVDYLKQKPLELQRVQHNPDPALHPFERPREYVRALNAVKLGRLFAKPFIRSFAGHRDAVYTLAKHPSQLSLIASGSGDGEVRLWNMTTGECLYVLEKAHAGFVRGIAINEKGQFLSCGDDANIKLWDVRAPTWIPQFEDLPTAGLKDDVDELLGQLIHQDQADTSSHRLTPHPSNTSDEYAHVRRFGAPIYQSAKVLANSGKPISSWICQTALTSISHQWEKGRVSNSTFATSSIKSVCVWDYQRSDPIAEMRWSDIDPDSYLQCSFNPVETDILAATATDRSFALFDLRSKNPIRKLVMSMNNNALAWNPMEAFNFTVANEDHNLYTFDMRNLDSALNVHMDHAAAVLDVDYSPTGQEFVSGSYDRTLRIFPVNHGRSREVYHTKRMQRIFCVRFSSDTKFVLSASDDTNIRLWKANASEPLGVLSSRETQRLQYQQQLINRYKHLPEISRIYRKRHVPQAVRYVQKTKHIINHSKKRKLANRLAITSPESVNITPLKKQSIIAEEE